MNNRVDGTLLNELQRSSRRLLPTALSALSDITSEVSGRPLEPQAFSRLSRFFLMHFCDQFVHEEFVRDDRSVSTPNSEFHIPVWTSAGKASSDGRQLAIASVLMNRCKNPSLLANRDKTSAHISAGRRLLSAIGKKSAPVVVVEPYLKCSRAQEISGALQLRQTARWTITPELSALSHEIDFSGRLAIVMRDPKETDRQTLIKRALALTAPIELVEGFHELSDQCARQLRVHQGVIYTANAYQSSSSFRFWVEHCRKHGGRLAIHQHGGGYGIDESHLGEEFDVSVSDVFYSWGWGASEDGIRSLPSAWPDRYTGQPSSEYLLMCLPITSHVYRLQPFLMPSQVSEAISHTLAFITGLSASTGIRVRMHQGDTFPLSEIGTCNATVLLDDLQDSGTVAATSASLVLHNYLSTSWLETLAMNVPTVCFYDPEMYSPRVAARPYIDALARVGVIHHSGAEAARFVNQLNGNPSAWWNSAEVQEVREAFVARYANFSDHWLQAWTEEFERLLDE